MKLQFTLFFLATFLCTSFALAQENATMEIQTKNIRQGFNFNVKVTGNEKLDSTAWVGIFDIGAADTYKTYQYVGNEVGKIVELKAPIQTGTYELRLYSADPGKILQKKAFKVISTFPNEYDIKIITQEINPSSTIAVSVKTTFETDKNTWLGIFKKDIPKDEVTYMSYLYIANTKETTVTMQAPNVPGDYTIRFYSSDPGGLIDELPFRVGSPDVPGIKFSIPKKAFNADEEITVTYTGHEKLSKTAWIGMFNTDAKKDAYYRSLSYQYLRPKLKGTLTFRAPTTKGKYEFRMLYAETGPQLLDAIPFEVSNSLDDKSLLETLNTKGKIVLYGIYFDTDKSIIKSESYALIEEIAKMLNADTSIKIQIEGHTDSQGNDTYNQTLSEKRAEAVANLLTQKYQVAKTQLQHKGFGETKPISDNKTASGRAKNRRVELKKVN